MNRIALWSILVIFVMAGCNNTSPPPKKTDDTANNKEANSTHSSELSTSQQQIVNLVASEDLIQSLAPKTGHLSRCFRETDPDLGLIFADKIQYLGTQEVKLADLEKESGSADIAFHLHWPLADSQQEVSAEQIWAPVLAVGRFVECQFGTLEGKFVGEQFQMLTKFEGKLETKEAPIGVKAIQRITWSEIEDGDWKIVGWEQQKLDVYRSSNALFRDVTAEAIPDKSTLEKIQTASNEALLIQEITSQSVPQAKGKYAPFIDWPSATSYPTISVVDLDKDGWEDLFVTDRWQSAQLLRNRGDGTFEDVTESVGLKIEELACASFFADFDNDGDSDLFVGGTTTQSKYFENVDGQFKFDESLNQRYEHMNFVVSGSVVDINRDGLLDLYLNTYGFGHGSGQLSWVDLVGDPRDRLKMKLKMEKAHWYVDRAGSANIVLMNEGGKLKRVKVGDELAQWKCTYQSVWADFDQDGDQDFYICNDFAPDYFLRNDTERGSMKPVFKEVSQEVIEGGTMGFGMGAQWGDYNNDGLLDLYVSNMYSKAGNRIVAQIDDVDERVKISAKGNFLYENTGGKFKQVAGLEDDAQHVSKVGWSFGGQMADFDNDGHLDMYVPSGYFTAPEVAKKPGDL